MLSILVHCMHLQGVSIVSAPVQSVDPLPLVDMQRCRDRESKALQVRLKDDSNAVWQCPTISCEHVQQAAQAEAAKTGIDVSTEAQQVFDALSKTMPCHWKQQKIIILNEVMLLSVCVGKPLPF